MTHVTCRLTAKNLDQLRNHTLGNRVRWATFFTQFNDSIILTKSVSVEAIGCEQFAQIRYAAAPWPGIELATS